MAVRSYKQIRPDGAFDAIVIGSGIGGLAVAALLSRFARRRVLVLERHYTAGGYTHSFRRRGYEWDVGLHYVGEIETGSGLEGLLDLVTGGALRWTRMPECYDRVFIGERAFDFVAGRERLVDSLAKDFPDERAGIERYLDLVSHVARASAPYVIDRGLPRWMSRGLGPLLRAPLRRYSDRTVEEVVRPLVKSPLLYDVLTAQCGDYGSTPREASFLVHALVASHFLNGAYYPVGGPSTIAEGAERVIAESGGEVLTNAAVRSIVVERGRAVGVEMEDGEILRAPVVVSDAGAPATFLGLLPRDVAEATGLPGKIRAIGPSSAHLCLHLGFQKTDDELGLNGTNLWVYPEGDREEAFARFRDDLEAPLPLTYVSFPSAKDPSFRARYPGRATVEVITLTGMDAFRRWDDTRWMKRGEAYEALKARLTERMLEVVYRHRPQLEGHVDHAELSTPLSTRRFTGHPDGEMYGLAHTPARFRLPLRAETPVPGLFLTGADLLACGVGGALIGGALTAGTILSRHPLALLRHRVRSVSLGASRGLVPSGA